MKWPSRKSLVPKKVGEEVVQVEKAATTQLSTLSAGGFIDYIKESFTGAWQKNVEIKRESVLSFSAVYACMSLISADIGKLRPMITVKKQGVFVEVEDNKNPFKDLFKRPNKYQTWQKFAEQYCLSKLSNGNTYVFKVKDAQGKVTSLHILDPRTCKILITTAGEIWYQFSKDVMANPGIETESLTVPQSEIIHDTMICLFHPLVGVSPIYACGLAATQGLSIQNNSTLFFTNMSRPSGMLSAPSKINDDTAKRLKEAWENNFSAGNIGRLAVLGDDLRYEAMTINAVDSQLLEQLKWTAETVCSCFHVPAYKIGVGDTPTYNNAEVLNQIYYTDCLQSIIESMEECLEWDLGIHDAGFNLELELDGLLRMDTATQVKTLNEGVKGGWMKPNEARQKRNMLPVKGGDTPYMQQQNFALSALAERDENSKLSEQANGKAGKKPTATEEEVAAKQANEVIAKIISKTKKLFETEEQD